LKNNTEGINIMQLKRKVIDIAQNASTKGITYDVALNLLKSKMDTDNYAKLLRLNNEDAIIKIAAGAMLMDPQNIFIHSGSDEDAKTIKQAAISLAEELPLANDSHTYHFDLKDEQGRLPQQTFTIYDEGDRLSSLKKKVPRKDAADYVNNNLGGILKDKTMFVGAYCRGPIGAPNATPSLIVTQSAYVINSASILYRSALDSFDSQVNRCGYFITNYHAQGNNTSEELKKARVFTDHKNLETWSIFTTYAGNSLRLKKGNHEINIGKTVRENTPELVEHMFITGMEIKMPDGNNKTVFITGAAPSGCGKTTTAMAGKHFIGDDLAEMYIHEDGTLRAINPEQGVFAIVKDVNPIDDPMVDAALKKPGVIWSNILVTPENTVHWLGDGKPVPAEGINFQGEWHQGMVNNEGKEIPMSHPNARATFSARALENYSEKSEDPEGVPVGVITYSGRDSDTNPPIRVAANSDEGVVIGGSIVSAATATEVGATGIKLEPFANRPFMPGSLGDNIKHQLEFGRNESISKKPVYAGINYFLTEAARGGDSNKLLGEKRDVKVWLSWLAYYSEGLVASIDTPIGGVPKYEDLKRLFSEILDKEYTQELYNKQFSIYVEKLIARIDKVTDDYNADDSEIPARFFEVLEQQKSELLQMKAQYGEIVTPAILESIQK